MTGHVVICNWTDAAADLLRTMHPAYAREGNARSERHDVVVVSPVPVVFPHEPCFTSTYLMLGEPGDQDMMTKANVEAARTIILLADRSRADPDNRTLTLALAMNRYLESRGKPTIIRHDWTLVGGVGADSPMVRVVAEVIDPGNASAMRRSALTGIHEVICEDDLGLRILAQATESAGVSRVLADLLDRSSDSSEIYQVPVPDRLLGATFDSMRALYDLVYGDFERESGEASIPVLIGVSRTVGGVPRFVVNPLNSYFRKEASVKDLRPGDRLLVVCKGDCDADLFFHDQARLRSEASARASGNGVDA